MHATGRTASSTHSMRSPDKSSLVVTMKERNEGFFNARYTHAPGFGKASRFSPSDGVAVAPGPGRYNTNRSSFSDRGVSIPSTGRAAGDSPHKSYSRPTTPRAGASGHHHHQGHHAAAAHHYAAGSAAVAAAAAHHVDPFYSAADGSHNTDGSYNHHAGQRAGTSPDREQYFGVPYAAGPGPGRYNVAKSLRLLAHHAPAATFGTSTRFPESARRREDPSSSIFGGPSEGPGSAAYQKIRPFMSNTGHGASFGKAARTAGDRRDVGPGPGRYSPAWGLLK